MYTEKHSQPCVELRFDMSGSDYDASLKETSKTGQYASGRSWKSDDINRPLQVLLPKEALIADEYVAASSIPPTPSAKLA